MQSMINTLLDPIVNFGKVIVSTGYNSTDTTPIVLTTGHGSKLPNPASDGSFNLVWYDSSTYASASDDPNVEIVRCIARVGDSLTLMRSQEGTLASNKNTPASTYKMILSPTKKTITDIKTEYESGVSTHAALDTGIHGVGGSYVESTSGSASKVSTHAGITSSVHGFDSSGNAPAQTHGISKHTGNIGTEANITFSTSVGHAHTGTDSTTVDHTNLSNKGTNTHAQIDTALTASAGHIAAAAPHSGHETPTGAQTKVDTHSALSTGVHGVGASTVESTTGSTSKVSTHAGVTTSVHGFDSSGNTPAQTHGISKHTGNIGTESNITFSNTVGHAHTGSDSTTVDHINLSNKGTNTHAQIDTVITASVGHIAAAAPHSGHETPAGAQAKVDTHSALSAGVHGVGASTVESTTGSQAKVGTHAGLTTVHGSTSAATASAIMQRDINGRAKVVAPSAIDDIAIKSTVDTVQTNLDTHTNNTTTAHGVTGAVVGTTNAQTMTNKTIKTTIGLQLPVGTNLWVT